MTAVGNVDRSLTLVSWAIGILAKHQPAIRRRRANRYEGVAHDWVCSGLGVVADRQDIAFGILAPRHRRAFDFFCIGPNPRSSMLIPPNYAGIPGFTPQEFLF
jgi:hypothetical protein